MATRWSPLQPIYNPEITHWCHPELVSGSSQLCVIASEARQSLGFTTTLCRPRAKRRISDDVH